MRGRGEGRWCRGRTGGCRGRAHAASFEEASSGAPNDVPPFATATALRRFGFGFAGLGRAAPNPGVLGSRSYPRRICPCEPGGMTFLTREDTMTMVLTVL